MAKHPEFNTLIIEAKRGNKDCLNKLAMEVRPRLHAFIYRTTLDEEVTSDVIQETLLQMVESLSYLKKIESFWPWLFRIASNKTNQFFRKSKKLSHVEFSTLEDSLLDSVLKDDSSRADKTLIQREMGQLVIEAISTLKHRQRAVVSLRCFEQMKYSEIAQSIGCTQIDARVAFLRAKIALKKQLSRRGFSKSSLILALTLFGKMTSSSEAAAMALKVSPAMLKTGSVSTASAAYAKLYGTKILATAAISVIAVGTSLHLAPDNSLNRDEVKSVYFVRQQIDSAANSGVSSAAIFNDNSQTADSRLLQSKGAYETWLSFPKGSDGPVIRKEQRWNIEQTQTLCAWLQDGDACYYYHNEPDNRAVYITNDPLELLTLPTDPPKQAEFIRQMCDQNTGIDYISHSKSGLLMAELDNRLPGAKRFETNYQYNKFGDDAFKCNWPPEVKVVDQRDQMHKRGWTYFKITGRIGDKEISGRGRIPFTCNAYNDHLPWLQLKVSDKITIVDTISGAYLLDNGGEILAAYPAGSFFKGLGRPWMGIRAYDTVRRDAAEKEIEFKYERIGEAGRVTVLKKQGYSRTTIDYSIDMQRDIIERIDFSKAGTAGQRDGFIRISYIDDVTAHADEFIEPDRLNSQVPLSQSLGMSWLLAIADDELGEF